MFVTLCLEFETRSTYFSFVQPYFSEKLYKLKSERLRRNPEEPQLTKEEKEVIYPKEWTSKEEELVEEGSEEWVMVQNALEERVCAKPFVDFVVKVERIQNRDLYKQYYEEKKKMEKRAGGKVREKWAKHSASKGLKESYDPNKSSWGFTYDVIFFLFFFFFSQFFFSQKVYLTSSLQTHQVTKYGKYIILARVVVGKEGEDSQEKKRGDYTVVSIRHSGAYPAYRVHFVKKATIDRERGLAE